MKFAVKNSYATNNHFKMRFYIIVKTRVKPVIHLQKNSVNKKCAIIVALLNKSEDKTTNNKTSKTYTTSYFILEFHFSILHLYFWSW